MLNITLMMDTHLYTKLSVRYIIMNDGRHFRVSEYANHICRALPSQFVGVVFMEHSLCGDHVELFAMITRDIRMKRGSGQCSTIMT